MPPNTQYIPTGEWVLTTNTFTNISSKDLFQRPFTGRPLFVFHSHSGSTTVLQSLLFSLSSQPWISGWTTKIQPDSEYAGEASCFAIYKVVGECVGGDGEKVDKVSGRVWWVVFVNGNRVMEREVYSEKYRDADWEKERKFDGRNEQDNELVVKWLVEEVRRDVLEMMKE